MRTRETHTPSGTLMVKLRLFFARMRLKPKTLPFFTETPVTSEPLKLCSRNG